MLDRVGEAYTPENLRLLTTDGRLTFINAIRTANQCNNYDSDQPGPTLTLNFDNSLTVPDNKAVQNSAWTLDSSDENYYVLTINQVIASGGTLSVGLSGTLNPDATTGTLSLTTTLTGGGETRVTNNTDADRIDYFQR